MYHTKLQKNKDRIKGHLHISLPTSSIHLLSQKTWDALVPFQVGKYPLRVVEPRTSW